jgi:hypothetical protein
MRKKIAVAILGFTLAASSGTWTVSVAQAANPHSGGSTGIPNVECGDPNALGTPGRASNARGSAFNELGTGHNAYEAAGAPSQYDVACFQVSPH